MSKAAAVVAAARNEERTTALANRDIDDQVVTAAFTTVSSAREKAAEVVLKNTAQREAAAAQAVAEKGLLKLLREVQTAAKQNYARTNRLVLADYYVGQKLNGNQPNLAQTSQTIIEKLAGDKLPGFTPSRVKAVETARTNWVDSTEAQSAAETAAADVRGEFKTLLKNVSDSRVAIQLAADAQWPHTEAEHRGVRKEFALPSNQPAKV